jgi:hypothetical protein
METATNTVKKTTKHSYQKADKKAINTVFAVLYQIVVLQ